MPELPEVETVCRGIAPYIVGQPIQCMTIRNPHLRWKIADDLVPRVLGQSVLAVQRRSKYILWQLDRGTLIWHLGMSGVMRIFQRQQSPAKHDHVDVVFANKALVRFTDPRRFGALFYSEDWQKHPLLVNLAPEPLSKYFNAKYLSEKLRKTHRAIKLVLMDSHIIVGVGNIYASEALFLAHIHPAKIASSLSKVEIMALVHAVKSTLQKAIALGGTTLKDFTQCDGKPGYFRNELQVYDRKDQPCLICQQEIQKTTQGQRATYFCPQCQI